MKIPTGLYVSAQGMVRAVVYACVIAVCCSVFMTSTVGAETELGEGNVSIRIKDGILEPTTLSIEPGTTVMWINSGGNNARVRFLSEAVSTTCQAPHGFVLGKQGIYESEVIKDGKVASLCFLERREYQYEVEFLARGDQELTSAGKLQGSVRVD